MRQRGAERPDPAAETSATLLRKSQAVLHAEFAGVAMFEVPSVKAFLRGRLLTLSQPSQLLASLRRHYLRRCNFCSTKQQPALFCSACGGPRFTDRELPSIEQLRRFITLERDAQAARLHAAQRSENSDNRA